MWISTAISGYFFSAATKVVDKILLSRSIPNPRVYVFYAGILSAPILLLIPFMSGVIQMQLALEALFAGACLLASLFFFYCALGEYDASRVVPIYAAATPFAAFFLSGEVFGVREMMAFSCLVVGGVLLSRKVGSAFDFEKELLLYSLAAAIIMGSGLSLVKDVFSQTSFINGFVLTRIGTFLAACALFFLPSFRADIASAKKPRMKHAGLFVGNKIAGAIGALFITIAVDRGPVSLVQALGSFEYLFVFIFVGILSLFAPRLIRESFSLHEIFIKMGGGVLLGIALVLLFI